MFRWNVNRRPSRLPTTRLRPGVHSAAHHLAHSINCNGSRVREVTLAATSRSCAPRALDQAAPAQRSKHVPN